MAEETHNTNMGRVRALDAKIRALYSSSSSLVNSASEAISGYGRFLAALDQRQLGILRRHVGAFVRPTVVPPKVKPGSKPVPSAALASASQSAKKLRSRGKSRANKGLPPHPAPTPAPPVAKAAPAQASSTPVVEEVRYPARDIRQNPDYKPPTTTPRHSRVPEGGDLRLRLERKANKGEGSKPSSGETPGSSGTVHLFSCHVCLPHPRVLRLGAFWILFLQTYPQGNNGISCFSQSVV